MNWSQIEKQQRDKLSDDRLSDTLGKREQASVWVRASVALLAAAANAMALRLSRERA
jgi:hypothetical protein